MTPEAQAAWFIQHPDALGRQLGFTDFRKLHGDWIRWIISDGPDGTLQGHRGSYKTSCLKLGIALLMIKHPDWNIIFLRKTDTDVSEVIRGVDRILHEPLFCTIFRALTGSDLQVTKSTTTEITTNIYSSPGGADQLLGIGIGGSLTGKHADIVITDDIVNLKDRISRAERERTKQIYQELQNVKNRGGRIINTGTPWHKEDAFSLMPPPMVYDWRSTGLITPEKAEALRASMSPSLFAANYELRHIAVENALFTDPPTFTTDTNLLRDGRAHIDAAYGGSDYTAYTAGCRRGDKMYMYGRLWKRHVSSVLPECIQETKRLLCGRIYVEDNGDKGFLARDIRLAGGSSVPYHEAENKHLKISTFLRKWWPHIVWLEGTDPEYLNQIIDYTEDAEHDDAPDSAASLIRVLEKKPADSNYTSVFDRQF